MADYENVPMLKRNYVSPKLTVKKIDFVDILTQSNTENPNNYENPNGDIYQELP